MCYNEMQSSPLDLRSKEEKKVFNEFECFPVGVTGTRMTREGGRALQEKETAGDPTPDLNPTSNLSLRNTETQMSHLGS